MIDWIKTRLFSTETEDGQGTSEYGLLIAVAVIVVIGLMLAFSGALNTLWENAVATLTAGTITPP